jgi:protein-tyrosine-phosphatase
VPDPYYGEMEDFEKVLDIVEEGVAGLFRELNAPP